MPRYIDAEELNLYDDLFMSGDTINKSGVYVRYRAVENLIKNAPTADVQEVKHGKWVKSETDRQYCSICHEVRPYYFKETLSNRYAEQKKLSLINWECPYCPNCGAKMDGKVDGKENYE